MFSIENCLPDGAVQGKCEAGTNLEDNWASGQIKEKLRDLPHLFCLHVFVPRCKLSADDISELTASREVVDSSRGG